MIYAPFRYLFTGVIIGIIAVSLSNDYVIISRRRYNKLRHKQMKDED